MFKDREINVQETYFEITVFIIVMQSTTMCVLPVLKWRVKRLVVPFEDNARNSEIRFEGSNNGANKAVLEIRIICNHNPLCEESTNF